MRHTRCHLRFTASPLHSKAGRCLAQPRTDENTSARMMWTKASLLLWLSPVAGKLESFNHHECRVMTGTMACANDAPR